MRASPNSSAFRQVNVPRLTRWPRIVAEALRAVPDPVDVAMPRLAMQPLATTLQRIADAAMPAHSTGNPPSFLLPHQIDPWRRVMAALCGWGGALLAERPGTGKTWIALGSAAADAGPVVAVVPAILRGQWECAATRSGVRVTCWTHERTSRGVLPSVDAGLVIVDEAHRFRDPSARRTRTLAPWLVSRRVLLITATPIVNRMADLLALLHLVVPDDALALDGIPRLGDLEGRVDRAAALRRVVIRSAGAPPVIFARKTEFVRPDSDEIRRGEIAVDLVNRLALSESITVRRLLRSVLLDAAGSSDAALWSALSRYRALLLQARDAGGASRTMLRRFAGETLDQLVLWPILDVAPVPGDLPLDDLRHLEAILAGPAPGEAWIGRLIHRCLDGEVTTCFTRHRATAQRLRETMGDCAAWVTGVAAGIGPHRMERQNVLAAFGPARSTWRSRRNTPLMLIATDVAAEGLDLHAAGRIVHVDLPWTAMRVEQREGRLLRLGQHHQQVEVVVRIPPPAIEAALAPAARIDRKGNLTRRWLAELEWSGEDTTLHGSGAAVSLLTDGGAPAALVAVHLARGERQGMLAVAGTGDGDWTTDQSRVDALFDRARCARSIAGEASQCVHLVGEAVRAALTFASPHATGHMTGLITRIHAAARRAASRRDAAALTRLDRLLRFTAASPTTGARATLAQLAALSDDHLMQAEIADSPAPDAVTANAIAAVMFR